MKQIKFSRAIIIFLVGLVSIFFFSNVNAQVDKTEIRGVWLTNVDSEVLYSKHEMKSAIKRLKKLNFNTLYPTVWQGGYTLYPSQVAEQVFGSKIDPHPGLKKRDMLQEIVRRGHKQGFKVIPWFEFGFMAPADSELVRQHPDWLTQRLDGTTIKTEGIHERVWLNPFHPEVQKFMLDLVTEVVRNYDVDGIQFDDHFGLPAEFGYDNFTVAMYEKELKGLKPSDNFQETFWSRWRADKINQFMEKIFSAVKEIKPNCLISLSPNPLHFALPAHLQDWFTWERKGFIEEIVLQVYRDDLNRFTTELERTEVELAKNHIPVAIGILTGLKNRPTPINTIESQVREVRKRNFAGVSFFFYESIWNWGEESPLVREEMIKKLFSNAIPRTRNI